MAITPTITPQDVIHMGIFSTCTRGFPCQHVCKIILNDGRQGEGLLSAAEITSLIQAIPLKYQQTEVHAAHFKWYDGLERRSDIILTRLFASIHIQAALMRHL